ncbi:hypothetical protein TorRG33x02_152990 [Trema orientale]|uniref:Uncharacterized protein n=1 Tax=Trema orientale TaxID=63057 RepID=A0A2P5ETT0_TREOI|nr:hypothetical protein TorRG33x02_152990 [Trema orientale]
MNPTVLLVSRKEVLRSSGSQKCPWWPESSNSSFSSVRR